MLPIVLIPAYKPAQELIAIVQELIASQQFESIVCVNDGSGEDFDNIFIQLQALNITILTHAVNLGKGNALKTGINHIAVHFPDTVGIVTLDADGQHLAADCCKCAQALIQNPQSLILGVRTFDQKNIPLRSKIGNILTSKTLKIFAGIALQDTQTGLRAIPSSLFKDLLHLKTGGYDFELDMLMLTQRKQISIIQVPIETVYIDGNQSSHFNPFLDSFKIYMVFLRFNVASLITFVIDNLVFGIATLFGSGIALGIVLARTIAGLINYTLNKNFVFKSQRSQKETIILYITTVIIMGFFAYLLVLGATHFLNMNLYIAKISSELLLYGFSFIIQRDFIFTHKKPHTRYTSTDWNKFYQSRCLFSSITANLAFSNFKQKLKPFLEEPKILTELGGGNSIFYPSYRKSFPKVEIYLLDQCNPMQDFLNKTRGDGKLNNIQANILTTSAGKLKGKADLVLSFGLIQYFPEEDTSTMVARHFEYAKPNGLICISFPTPTMPYSISRTTLELINKWPFHDERPLSFYEVEQAANKHGTLLSKSICHRLGLSQGLVIYRKL